MSTSWTSPTLGVTGPQEAAQDNTTQPKAQSGGFIGYSWPAPAGGCPRCGYCPHCGRGGSYQQPWQSPFWSSQGGQVLC